MNPLLSVKISLDYPTKAHVLKDVAFELPAGEILGVAGLSGSGKSSLALAIMGLLPDRGACVRGSIYYDGQNLLTCKERVLRSLRGREISLVLQAAASALNPELTLGAQIKEAWRVHASGAWSDQKNVTASTLNQLGLESDPAFLRRYPGEISIGQAQRILIAMAVLHRPRLLMMDEPTSALDSIARAEVLSLVRKLNQEWNVTVLYISHDLSAIANICHRIAILHDGKLVEIGPAEHILAFPTHPFTKRLTQALHQEHPYNRAVAIKERLLTT